MAISKINTSKQNYNIANNPIREPLTCQPNTDQNQQSSINACQKRLRRTPTALHPGNTHELLNVLIKYGNNPDGIPPLLYAAKMGDLKAVELLIQNGADLNTKNHNQNNTLYFALLSKNIQVVKFFLENGIDPNSTNMWLPVWYDSIKLNDVESFKLLMKYGLRLDTGANINQNPAVVAIYYGSLDLLKCILTNGGELPHPSMFEAHQNPVLWSVASRSENKGKEKIECLKWLMSIGVLNLKTTKEFYIPNSYPEFVEYLIDNNFITINQKFYNDQASLVEVASNHPDVLKLVIGKGADVNAKSYFGGTALHTAVAVGLGVVPDDRWESIKILLDAGANVNLKDDMGRTPLSRAQNPKVRELLMRYGAKP
jgi:ankyrin repeat protein